MVALKLCVKVVQHEISLGGQAPLIGSRTSGFLISIRYREPFKDIGYDHDGNPLTARVGSGNAVFDFVDTNRNGSHDAGELGEPFTDIWINQVRGLVFPEAKLAAEIERGNIAWLQACISIELVETRIKDAPNTPWGLNILDDGLLNPSDQVSIVNEYGSDASPDVLEVFFAAPFHDPYWAQTFVPMQRKPGLGENIFAFVGTDVDVRNKTLAHELGHALENDDRDGTAPPQFIFYPAKQAENDDAVNRFRRLEQYTINRCLRTRGSATDVGNTLLKPY